MRVHLDSLGCRLNQSEIERMGRQFRAAGHRLVPSPEQSDLVVINSCAVTQDAAATSRARARRAHRRSPSAGIVITGCWASLEPSEAMALPGVEQVIPNGRKSTLVPDVLGQEIKPFDLEPVARRPLPGLRTRTRAFIKAQDGCDHHCTYCITRLARGPARSLTIDEVVAQVDAAVEGGAQEAVLTGVQLSGYGQGSNSRIDLTHLVRAVLDRTGIPRLRLSSLEPWNLPDGLLELWQDPRLCRQLHLPLQSGSSTTLRRMARPIQPDEFGRIVDTARDAIPDLAVTTDIIAGFPGETEHEFDASLSFIRAMDFADAHVFPYSPRSGTAAAKLPDTIDPRRARARAQEIRATVDASKDAFRRRFLHRDLNVLWESATRLDPDGWTMSGWSDNYIRVTAVAPRDLWNRICTVRVMGETDGGLLGTLVEQ